MAVDAFNSQRPLTKCLEMLSARDETHVVPRLRESPAEVAPDCARADDSDAHHRLADDLLERRRSPISPPALRNGFTSPTSSGRSGFDTRGRVNVQNDVSAAFGD